ncbi:WD40-repeat-containing domain protein [Halteromyces radiatus]|uniref:WD40-repeat-containing domain protein n=1 Tax=Halteromyces radiatus TaxID=101107 RepID=UPI002220928E|nr:WD40-repeat-containing domain protein [Halteromyces radiatus]KAI8086121.1 WD40-repeat-containing domain protein [Halteromyces radiatus]
MKAQARRKVSYVIRQPNGRKAHCLGVNSLAIDSSAVYNNNITEGGILYSAGRDGVVAGWKLHIPLKQQQLEDDTWIHDQEILSSTPATCDAFSQMHTDWVNDIVVCEQGTSVVSASADRTIKLWKPYSEDSHQAHTIGWHTDYVKCLAYAPQAGWVASGGLDKRINIWDLEKREASLTIQVGSMNINNDHSGDTSNTSHGTSSKSSIYAMAVNPSGTLLVTGSPEKVVRIWDPRSGKRVSKLTGHTDNIRALLISHDGQHVLSGSSDSTIKLWSVKAQRCLTTYETHTDSIWSLYSDHPDLKTFYAGSRDGLVTKTELPREGANEKHDESECIGLFKENSGVGKIVAFDDTYIWTATSSSSINRWLSVPSRENRQVLTRSDYNPDIPPSAIVRLPPTQTVFSPQVPEHFLPNDSLTIYAGSVMSIPMSYNDEDDDSTESLTPLREQPDQTIEGNPGITAHLVLQNRHHVLTKDTTGDVALWDIVRCTEIKKFGQRSLEEVAQEISGIESFPSWCSVTTKIGAITVQLLESNCFDCEMYADEIGLPIDYQYREDQRVNLGKWLLINLFSSFVTAELQEQEKSLKGHDNEGMEIAHHEVSSQDGTNTSQQQQTKSITSSDATPTIPAIQNEPTPPTPTVTALKIPLSAVTTNTDSSPFHPSLSNSPLDQQGGTPPNFPSVITTNGTSVSSQTNGPLTAPPTTGRSFDYFSKSHQPVQNHSSVQPPPPAALSSSPVSPTNSNFMHRLKNLSVKAKLAKVPNSDDKSEGYTTEEDKQTSFTSVNGNGDTDSALTSNGILPGKNESNSTTTMTDDNKQQQSQNFPPLMIPSSTSIIIAEESAEASTSMDLYRGEASCVGEDHALISKVAPSWLLAFLLYNKTPSKETVKLTFVLKPHSETQLPELPGGPNNRLLANRVLRIRKLLQYVAEKIELDPLPEVDDLELLCGDTVLTPTMTLASVKQHILKSSGDVILAYRYKNEASSLPLTDS